MFSRFLFLVLWATLLSTSHAFTLRSWSAARALANTTVSSLTTAQKLGLVAGVGNFNSRCVGNILAVPSASIPPICFQDGPAGLRLIKEVTGFPAAINAASTFSKRLIEARGVALGEESRGKGVNVLLGPALDIMRNPKAGRGWEGFGPDPYLSGVGGYHTILGIQSTGVQACAKHFAAYNQEHWRYGLSSDLDDRTMHEMYAYPFLWAIDANISSVMCAYNRVNDTSSCHNSALIGTGGILREAGFQGYFISDWGATHDSAPDNANAGLDMEQPGDWIVIGGGVYGINGQGGLAGAVSTGGVSMARLNEMATNVLAPFYRLGQESGFPAINFDAQNPDGSGALNLNVSVRSDAHTALVREIASASAVLLKNNRTAGGARGLPIPQPGAVKTVAVIGMDALLPNQNCGNLNECNDGTMSIGWGSGSNSLEYIVPPIEAIQSFIASATASASVTLTTSLSNDLTAGPAAAKGKDVAIVFANAMSGELGFYDIVDGNMGDRNDLDLWFKGGSLIQDVAAVCANTIVVIHSVGPVYMPWSTHPNITAIIYAGAPGEQTGPSIVDVLWGAYSPHGRLPFSIADDEASYETSIVYNSLLGEPDITYTEKLLLDYRYMASAGIVPRFEFGFGLTYTTFGYSALSIGTAANSSKIVSFTVANTGAAAGTEHPQLYLGFPGAAGEPPRVLRGFEEVPLGVGASASVSMEIAPREMSVWDTPSQSWVQPAGTFTVYVGASSLDIRLTGTF